MKFYCYLVLLLVIIIEVQANYPESSLQCKSTLTAPDQKLICPAARAKWCVKEVVGLQQDLCGKTQYFGDEYANSECQFKMCSDSCTEGEYTFEYGGSFYTRKRYCCNNVDYCNAGNSAFQFNIVLISCIIAVVCYIIV